MVDKIIWAESFHEEEQLADEKWDGSVLIEFCGEPLQDCPLPEDSSEYLVTIRTHSRFPEPWRGTIKGIVSRSTGYDHLDPERLQVPAGYLPDYATEAVADHNLTVTMAMLRQLWSARSSIEQFNRNQLTGEELSSRTIGIVGVGNIGRATAERFLNLGCQVFGYDVEKQQTLVDHPGFQYLGLDELFSRSDVLLLCLPLNEETEKMITLDHLRTLPEGSYLVNSGRGEVVSNRDLLSVLREGPVKAMALDVFNREHEVADYLRNDRSDEATSEEVAAAINLIDHDRVLATPHNGFNTREALERKVEGTLASVRQFLRDGTFPDPVPMD